jgi:TolB-like protein/Flp pilus assembly protein TadD
MNLKKYIADLKSRNVFKPAITYLIVAWLVAQVSDIVLPTFNAPPYFMKTLIFILIIGFPIILVFAWIYELTPQGIKKTKNEEMEISISPQKNHRLNKDNKKLAVLPFQNISTNNGSNYFSDGLTEEIIIRLSGIKELEIASRRTSMQYRDSKLDIASLGRELNARYLLQGTVRKHNYDLRISVELIDVEKDSTLWAEIYSGKMADVFVIQEQVSKKIVKSLQIKLTDKEKVALGKKATTNSEAHDANLKAREFLFRYTKNHLLLAIDLFQNAIDLDPKYAAAYAGMSEACALLYETHDKKPIWLEKAEESSLKALIYDPTSSEAYSALGLVYYDKNLLNEALIAVQKAISFDQDNFFAYWIRGRLYRMMDRDSEAIIDFNKVLDLNGDFHSAFGDLQMSYEKLEDKENLQDTIQRAALFYPSYLLHNPDDARAHQFYAFTLKRLGRLEEAKEEMNKGIEQNPNDPIIIYNGACFYALTGNLTAAIENLKKAMDNGFENYEYIKHDPDLNSLRKEPDFIALMQGK